MLLRSVKYALAEKYGFRKDYDTNGNYSVYTNEITELSTLQENAYLTKYGHYDSYYEEILGAKTDRYEQLYEYFKEDEKILTLTTQEQQFLADFTCLSMGEAGKVAAYRDIHTLAEMLKYNMKDSGSGREVIVEGNTIIIRIEGTTDIYTGKEIETHEYRLEFNSEELFGSYCISAGEYVNVMGQYSALRIKEGYLGSVQMEELEKQAIRMMESCYTKESLESLSKEEYNELLQSCMISADLSGLVYAGYETEHVRAVESFNELKDTFINTFGMVVLAASMTLPPTAPLALALFGADAGLAIGDGILRISQGDELEGTIEAFAGALALGEFAYIVKATRGASKVTNSVVPNGSVTNDELDEVIEVIKFKNYRNEHTELDELEKFYEEIFEQQREICPEYEDFLEELQKLQDEPYLPVNEIDNMPMDNHLNLSDTMIGGERGGTSIRGLLQNPPEEILSDIELKEISLEALEKCENAGLSNIEVENLRKIQNTKKPAPETYLESSYINMHIEQFKDNGCYKIISDKRGEPTGTIGNEDLFVINGVDLENILQKANGNPRIIEDELAMPSGYLGDNPYIIRADNPENLRMATGNEANAWQDEWCPAGVTRAGVDEAIIDPLNKGDYSYKHCFGESEWKK